MDLSKTGRLIAGLRQEKGLTQKEVADRLDICGRKLIPLVFESFFESASSPVG